MIEIINNFEKIPAAKVYVDFGLEQTRIINKRFEAWLAKQSFAIDVEDSRYNKIIIKGGPDYSEEDLELRKDNIQWELSFSDQLGSGGLENALLHEKRYPDISHLNSKPQIFDTADYIHIRVSNGKGGWVEEGEFPVNLHIGKDYEAIDGKSLEIPPIMPILTDIRIDAIAGFEAAYHWQCFRAMALCCSGYVTEKLKGESKGIIEFDETQHMRSRRENVWPFFVELLPDTRIEEGASALKSFYWPGILEGTLALELEHAVHHQFGINKKDDVRPISIIKGYPIEITPTDNSCYDALMKFRVQTYSYGSKDDENVRLAVEQQLAKHYSVKFKNPSEIEVEFELKDAHLVEQAIIDGANDTKIHRFARNFGDALRHIDTSYREWNKEKIPDLEKIYKGLVDDTRENHFSALESKFSK